ncbi:MAG: aquaporin [Actinobacteria bacterium]|nr:aquaporin [Actinomycetota bacterium]MCB9390843.1 aquaporin [Acidimicrobiia bacterium]
MTSDGETTGASRAQLTAEFVGTATLVTAVVGSGIMAQNLSVDEGLILLQNAFATAAALVALILAFGPASGAHFNPVVTLAAARFGALSNRAALAYVAAQTAGAILGVIVANAMFGLPVIELSSNDRGAAELVFSETVATFGLVLVIFAVVRSGRAHSAAFAVGGYIAGAYYFTSSTSFANPAVTAARTLSDTFTGIAPASAPAFIAAQIVGALAAVVVARTVYPHDPIDNALDDVSREVLK